MKPTPYCIKRVKEKMKTGEYASRAAEFLNTFIGKEGCSLIKTEFVTEDGLRYLRAYIDLTDEEREKRAALIEKSEETEEVLAPEVTINDCAAVSRRLSKWLDTEDFIEEEYTLEVCSRGYLKEEGENS